MKKNSISHNSLSSGIVTIIGSADDDVLTLTQTPTSYIWGGTIDGGGGTDTLRLVSEFYSASYELNRIDTFSGIEIIRGSSDADRIFLRDDQLSGVMTIDGGANSYGDENTLGLYGTNLDLRSLLLLNINRINVFTNDAVIRLSDKTLALAVTGYSAQNDHLILDGFTLTDEERLLLHSRGVDKITDASGVVSANAAPTISNLDGASIRTAGKGSVLLDADSNAVIADDDGVVDTLSFLFEHEVLLTESIGIDTQGSVRLSDGLFDGSRISVDGDEIGVIRDTGGRGFSVWILEGATANGINKLLQAITYVNASTDVNFAAYRNIIVTATDDGHREGRAIIGVTVGQPDALVLTSHRDNLIGTSADEIVVADKYTFNSNDVLDGGGGFDTLTFSEPLEDTWPYPSYDFTLLGDIRNIEKIQGADVEERFHFDARALASFSTFDGGSSVGPEDTLVLHGQNLDLRNKTFLNFDYISVADDGATITINDASLYDIISARGCDDTHVVLEGGTFDSYERDELFFNGVDKVTDASGTYTEDMPDAPTSPTTPRVPTTPTTPTGPTYPVGPVLHHGTARGDAITGWSGQDVIYGFAANDVIRGADGDDRLYGGSGKDTISGDMGRDVFVFDTRPNKKNNFDTITDFNVKDDTIWLDNKVFKKLGKKGSADSPAKLKKDFFTIGTKAKDKNDYLIYNKKKGVLYYDQDGSGAKKAIEVVKLINKAKLTAADLLVV